MKKRISGLIGLLIIFNSFSCVESFAKNDSENYISQLSEVVSEYDDGNFFQTMTVTIGEKNIKMMAKVQTIIICQLIYMH